MLNKRYKNKLTVTVANPKTPEEYGKMIDDLNEYFKIRYSTKWEKSFKKDEKKYKHS